MTRLIAKIRDMSGEDWSFAIGCALLAFGLALAIHHSITF